MEILRVENLSFSYPNENEKAIDNISFTVNKGDFVLLCGKTSSGKSTLLKLLKPSLSPQGDRDGSISFNGEDNQMNDSKVGFVMQNPENQVVTDIVWRELAFGLENQGLESDAIKSKVAEISSYFDINDLFDRKTTTLSGGQLQLVNLASVLVMTPDLIVLDEPTSQLDPIAASNFIATLKRLNDEFGITVIISEHRLEELFSHCHKVLFLENGRCSFYGSPKLAAANINKALLPTVIKIGKELNAGEELPLRVREVQKFILDNYSNNINSLEIDKQPISRQIVLELKNIWFKFADKSNDVLKGVNLNIYQSEIFCILGANGSGKTTLLKSVLGLFKAYRGKIKILNKNIKDYKGNTLYKGNLALLPQNPIDVFVKDKVIDDFKHYSEALGLDENSIDEIVKRLSIENILNKHPYDLSGGELQKCAIAKTLLSNPKVLIMDEPTKGIDSEAKLNIINLLNELKRSGVTVIIATHDVEFVALCADRCGLLFNGEVISVSSPYEFFSGNNFYTTAASKITKGIFKNTITSDQVVELCQLNGKLNI